MEPTSHSVDNFSDSRILTKILCKASTSTGSSTFKSSDGILSGPADLLVLSFLIARVTSLIEGGGGGLSSSLMKSCSTGSSWGASVLLMVTQSNFVFDSPVLDPINIKIFNKKYINPTTALWTIK
ncbi:hypothetical protein AVEN_106927-1 [Araneus ventricosus]|uniref:Uncharacterized protein n=1 Tax=Araneus ventricosus TaxID=182803 RepID=A0A4Y2JWR5_ARAVE|nr:hypothetical protein AVEN_106927-1 [Araneus ventricosus]